MEKGTSQKNVANKGQFERFTVRNLLDFFNVFFFNRVYKVAVYSGLNVLVASFVTRYI